MNQNANLLIDLDKVIKSKAPSLYKKTPGFLINWLKKKIHQDEINEIIRLYGDREGVDFMSQLIHYFNLTLHVEGLENIAKNERYIFASNHPLGGLDGICLSAIIGTQFDKNINYLVNDLLLNIKPLQDIFVPINKHGKQSKENYKAQNAAFESDNQIITFPAGLCSRKKNGQIRDPEWKKSFIIKAVETKRSVVPVYFEGRNSNFFYNFANIRKALGIKFNIEMLFLPDEMFKGRNKTYRIVFGKPISYKQFDNATPSKEWAEYVRSEVYKMKGK